MNTDSEHGNTLEGRGLPGLYYAADQTAIRSQRTYLRLFASVLVLTATAPAAIILATLVPCASQPMRYIAGISLLSSLLITAKVKENQKERTWYGARAVAESVKTSAWRFATCADPFVRSLDSNVADKLLLDKLADILDDRKSLNFSVAGEANSKPEITLEMRQLRAATWENRLSAYVEQRIRNQRDWYSKKAAFSEKRELCYFLAVMVVQVISIGVAFAFATWPAMHVNFATVFTSGAMALLAWLQVKRYQETSQSYAITANELGIIEASAATVQSEDQLTAFVRDAENAMSREHTLWVARRDAK